MTDDLDRLARALRGAAPAPDPEKRAEHIRRAMESFDRAQEAGRGARPIADRPARAGFAKGLTAMLSNLTTRPAAMLSRLATRPALALTTSAAALGLVLFVALPEMQRPGMVTPPAEPAARKAAEGDAAATPPAPPVVAAAPQERARDLAAGAVPAPAPRAEMPPGGAVVHGLLADSLAERELGLVPGDVSRLVAPDAMPLPQAESTEAFANADPNPLRITAEEPVSTFSVDVDTASYAVIRSSLMAGLLPPPEAVRIEEMVNYFPYDYPAPEAGEAPFRASVGLAVTPWNEGTRLLRIGLQGRLPALADRPPLNLVFLIDTSGSMQDADKLPLLKQSFRLMLGQLRPEDQVAIVAYAGSAGEVLPPTPAAEREQIAAALDRLEAGGSTAGEAGLAQAYALAERMAGDGEVSRVILATDGDFNVGLSDPAALERFIAARRQGGIYLSVLGFGRGNLDDATMQALAQSGNGQAAYIDTLSEAQKVLADQLTGALFPIADDVKLQVEFNPAVIAEYRLIGYETRALRREDFANDRVDAGEIGAGHQVTALYEVTPVGSPAVLNAPLRYATEPAARQQQGTPELGYLKIRWKEPGAATSRLVELPIPPEPGAADADLRFAAAIAGMGQILTGATYLGDWGWDEAIALATGARGADPFGYRAEAVQLMRLAQGLAGR